MITTVGARKGKWSLGGDFIYLSVTAKNNSQVNVPIGPGIPVNNKVELKAFITTLAGGYAVVESEKFSLDLL